MNWNIVRVLALIGTVALLLIGLERYLVSVPVGDLTVTVLRVERAEQHDGTPRFQYAVALPDGGEERFASERIHSPGDRLVVTCSRGRITGRVWLGAPYRVVPGLAEGR